MAISKAQRALIVVNSLDKHSTGTMKFIYSFLQESGPAIANTVLGPHYKSVTVRKGVNGTRAKFLAALGSAATAPGIKAVDVFLQLHGSTNTFHFYDASVSAATLRDDILALGLPSKRLRLLYNTGCYGDSQNWQEMIAAGFATTIGSKKINTTGASEFPTFCALWQAGQTIKQVVAAADNPATRKVQDAAAKAFSPAFANSDSTKVIRGNVNLRITT